jgi:hypothetical protein
MFLQLNQRNDNACTATEHTGAIRLL